MKKDIKKESSMKVKKCPYCNSGKLTLRGPMGSSGRKRWKCRSCGRSVHEQMVATPPTPLVPLKINLTTLALKAGK